MTLFLGARTPDSLPYLGPLRKIPDSQLRKHLLFSHREGQPREYVQDRMIAEKDSIASMLITNNSYIYICGLTAMESGFAEIARRAGFDWQSMREAMRAEGRYHFETY